MRKKGEKSQEMRLGDARSYVTEGEIEYHGRKATIKINQETCVGAGMCVISCPVGIFESTPKSHLVKEKLHRCLLHACMKCRDNCPTVSVMIEFKNPYSNLVDEGPK